MQIADAIPSGIVHINEQTVSDEANAPFGGVAASGTGSRSGGAQANIEAFTETPVAYRPPGHRALPVLAAARPPASSDRPSGPQPGGPTT